MSLVLVQADARALPFAANSVQCCVTSPPYFGLRDYGITHQIGLEPTIDAYVSTLVAVFREVRRVLTPDGVCWLNLGDSYAANVPYQVPSTKGGAKHGPAQGVNGRARRVSDGLKPKDLCMIPARVALALQADGWYLRSEIVWSKPNPMPESVTDRPTKAHETIYLMSKAERYFYDPLAVREPMAAASADRYGYAFGGPKNRALSDANRDGVGVRTRPIGRREVTSGRNLRSVWHLATQPYAGAHFATMPERLVERCILAGSRTGDRVLDPFLGSGTVARVALRLGRRALGCDLNRAYLALADARTTVTYGLPFGEVSA